MVCESSGAATALHIGIQDDPCTYTCLFLGLPDFHKFVENFVEMALSTFANLEISKT